MVREYNLIINDNNILELKPSKLFEDELIIDLKDAIYFMRYNYDMDVLESEKVYLIGFDGNEIMIGLYCVSIGDYNTSNLYNRTIAASALLMSAKKIAVVHNHPGNNISASIEDMQASAKLNKLFEMLELEFLGCYIISRYKWKKVGTDDVNEWEDE